jgi:hypothetical protein
MNTLDFTQIKIQNLITHHVGNKLRDDKFILSNEPTNISEDTSNFLLKYFLLPIKTEEFYCFTHPMKLERNDVFLITENIFSNSKRFIENSQNIAKLLYEQSLHPKIQKGELNVVLFSNVILNDEVVEALGIFKSETNVPFLKMSTHKNKFTINHEFGFEIKGMDKGCIILNTNKTDGYRILIVDHANRSAEAQYWKDDFLKVKPFANNYHQTNEFLVIAKNYVTKQLEEEFEVSQADKIDLLNRSVEYFKSHESFNKNEFEKEVFQVSEIIESFQSFDTNYREQNDIEITNNFDISRQAVKKQARSFKNVLKLDKNFHIYIHGNRELIEQGVERDGRKFYKIYYEEEH